MAGWADAAIGAAALAVFVAVWLLRRARLSFSFRGDARDDGGYWSLTLNIRNRGATSARHVRLMVIIDGAKVAEQTVDEVPPGGEPFDVMLTIRKSAASLLGEFVPTGAMVVEARWPRFRRTSFRYPSPERTPAHRDLATH